MIVDESKFVTRYSFIYTFIVSIILLSPLYIYTDHKMHIQEIKTEIELKGVQARILDAMHAFGNTQNRVFKFPKLISYKSGLYNKKFEPIFTQIDMPLHVFSEGYHSQENSRYLITTLPEKKYFDATYLITETAISYVSIFFDASLLALGITALILLLSLYFLKSFSRPFKRVNEKLDMFIKDSMHEINTPLSIININIDLFNNIHGKNKYFNRIKSATKLLGTIYNDMDYLIKKNRIEYPDERILLEDFIQERMDYFQLIGELKDVTLHLHATKTSYLFINETKLQRLVDNNLSNAIKFSHKHNRVDVFITKQVTDEIKLCFKDYGNGIEKPEQVFNRYYREKSHKTGFGIGLDIVRTICEDYKIITDVESDHKSYSSFSYIFPLSMIKDDI